MAWLGLGIYVDEDNVLCAYPNDNINGFTFVFNNGDVQNIPNISVDRVRIAMPLKYRPFQRVPARVTRSGAVLELSHLGLSRRADKLLKAANIRTVQELTSLRAAKLMDLWQCGPVTLWNIRDGLLRHGLHLRGEACIHELPVGQHWDRTAAYLKIDIYA